MKLIDKDILIEEIEKLVDKGKYHEEFDFAYRDGNNGALYALKAKIDTLEVKEVDLNEEIKSYFKGFGMFPSVGIDDCIDIAKHFFELGFKTSNLITAEDSGTAEEIINNLKRVENDYHIDLTKEIEWVRNKAQKGE